MTNDELRELIEKNSQAIRDLKDSLTVEASLNATRERQYSQTFLEHQEWLKGLDRRLDAMTTIVEQHDARLDRIAALIERFLRGREGDGHKAE
jgi:hypothetical protein